MTNRVNIYMKPQAGLVHDSGRFLAAGLVNTLFTVAAYQLLLFPLTPSAAYALSWALGLAFVAIIYPTKVFRGGDASAAARALIVGVYLIGFCIGLGMINLLSVHFGIERFAIVAALIVTTLFNFFVMRGIVRRSA